MLSQSRRVPWWVAMALAIAACADDGAAPLQVETTEPLDLAVEVSPDAEVTLTFSEPLDASTVTTDTVEVRHEGGTTMGGSWRVEGSTATFTPDLPFALMSTYEATVSPAVTSEAGGRLERAASSSFTVREGAWGIAERIQINDPGSVAQGVPPSVVFDPTGGALVVWSQENEAGLDSIWSSRFVDGTWTAAELLENDDVHDAGGAHVAIDASGNAVAVWHQSDGNEFSVWANRFVDGAWGTAELLENDDTAQALAPRVALDAAGNGLVSWTRLEEIEVPEVPPESWPAEASVWATRLVDGAWGTPEALEQDPLLAPFATEVVLDAAGNGLVVWNGADTSSFYLHAARYADGEFAPTERIDAPAPTPITLAQVQVALDPSGNGMAVWMEGGALWARPFAEGSWGDAEIIEGEDPIDGLPQLALGPNGNGLVVWETLGTHPIDSLFAKPLVDGQWGAAERIAEVDVSGASAGLFHEVAVDASGNGVVVWRQPEGPRTSVLRARRFANGAWGSERRFETNDPDVARSQIAFDPAGRAIAVWGTNRSLWADRFE
ncbi:MAG: Ig-like domain-containing protein [Myxococcota bacterium]